MGPKIRKSASILPGAPTHLTAVLAKAVMQTLYRQPPKYAYFMGCSDGGREALMEAQRFPQDFDGISAGAGAPAAFFQFQNSFFHGWNVAANQRPDGTAILLKNRLPLIHQAVLAHCPTLSGVQDGILQNPYACQFSESWLPRCPADARDRSTCLTQEEIEVVKKLYRGAYDSHGAQFVAGGLPLGSELRWPVPETPTGHSMSEMMVLPALQSVLLPGEKQKIQSMRDFRLTSRILTPSPNWRRSITRQIPIFMPINSAAASLSSGTVWPMTPSVRPFLSPIIAA
ncbi:hydrolase [Klebsiella pneumoniae]|uniref:Hydrolase n=1 Tax=Klebsiella pneumoniae TaxID=573 RepID=A0A3S4GI89_KLEPN|nr:hydrolase [Klebsiella pneumoniae]